MSGEAFRTEPGRGTLRSAAAALSFAAANPALALGGLLLAFLAASALAAPLVAGYDPIAFHPLARLRPPGDAAHPWGTDMFGRDLFSRTLHGGRTSLVVGIGTALITSLVGLAIGLLAGFNRWADAILMRIMDGVMAIPGILLAIALATVIGGGLGTVLVATTVPEIPIVARLVRSVVLSVREQPFVDSARAIGTPTIWIILRHILPNTLAPLMVQATFICGIAILVEAYLSFVGAGVPAELPSWGNVMAEGRTFFFVAPWIMLIPGLFVAGAVLALNLVGDALRDILDPRHRDRRG
jgi:peptide/nickel transport system permease protein